MAQLFLTPWQLTTALALGGIEPPGPGSPLRSVPPAERPLTPTDPEWAELVERNVVRPDGRGGWRTNLGLVPFLEVACRPEEVISVGVDAPGATGFTIVRRGPVLAECTVGERHVAKLEAPLTRTAVILTVIGSLSGDRPEPTPTGFRFVGAAPEAFVLASALRAVREDPVPLTVERLRSTVAADLAVPARAAAFAVAGAQDAIAHLANDPGAVDDAIEALVEAGHLRARLDRLEISDAVEQVLGGEPRAVMGLGRTEVRDGRARSTSLTATRIGDRILTFRVLSRTAGPPRFEWAEATREDLRWLALGLLLSGEELDRIRRGERLEEVTAPPAAEPPAPATPPVRPTPEPAPAPAAAPPAPAAAMPPPSAPTPEPTPPQPQAPPTAPPATPPQPTAPPQPTPAPQQPPPSPTPQPQAPTSAPQQPTAPAPAPVAGTPPAATPGPWHPTHTVPATGLWAYAEPDPSGQAVASLDPHLPVQVDRTWGIWSHVVCSNGWETWVDGRHLLEGA